MHCKTVCIILLHHILPKSLNQYCKVTRKMSIHVFCYSTISVILLICRLLFLSLSDTGENHALCLFNSN